jgi:hypothetical protein
MCAHCGTCVHVCGDVCMEDTHMHGSARGYREVSVCVHMGVCTYVLVCAHTYGLYMRTRTGLMQDSGGHR